MEEDGNVGDGGAVVDLGDVDIDLGSLTIRDDEDAFEEDGEGIADSPSRLSLGMEGDDDNLGGFGGGDGGASTDLADASGGSIWSQGAGLFDDASRINDLLEQEGGCTVEELLGGRSPSGSQIDE